jgi:calcineurin-like phosphoesterase family protein
MPNTWFTADFHLGHKNIIRYCNRPFDSVEAMNCAILEHLNSAAKANDVLYFLGDFCIGPKARALDLRREIRCKKIFAVPGNHDKDTRKLTQEFSWLGDLTEVSINGQRIVLCHYAMRVWNHSSHCPYRKLHPPANRSEKLLSGAQLYLDCVNRWRNLCTVV